MACAAACASIHLGNPGSDVIKTLDRALAASRLDQVKVVHRPRLLSYNGASYIAGDLAEYSSSALRPGQREPS
ncbi:MAG TPA: hypothetical protein VE420_06840 [Gemmatimonadales bacterium]|nr:hypothetical protein [Gemmatimonadales bacterium]